ncbi:MAG: tannase/feruloyl esterase family alpha/beta hydrolase, partial [Rubrivivax sp.]
QNTCAALANADIAGLRIVVAEYIDADMAYPVNWSSRRIEGPALPPHCRLVGLIDERKARPNRRGGAAGGIEFELRLPTEWNERLFYQTGSDDGVQTAIGRNSGADGFRDNALARGYAVVSGNGGRPSNDAAAVAAVAAVAPASDAQARVDAAHRAHDRTATLAKALVERYYHAAPRHSYAMGCGDGGRQGLMFAQRYPAQFDGIVALAPALRPVEAAVAAAWTVQRLASVAPRARNGTRELARAFSQEELFRVADAVLESCDALDGAADGLVQDMAACRFDIAVLQCKRGKSKQKQCLSAAKTKALGEAMAGPRDAKGRPLYARWPWDPGIAAPGWRAWTLGDTVAGQAAEARHLGITAQDIGAQWLTPPHPKLGLLNVDFERDPKRLQPMQRELDTATDVQLQGFRQRNGKLLMIHGAADPVFSAWDTVDYQQRLSAAHGKDTVAGIARTFIVPGMNHCAGGPATDRFDALSAIVDWVEKGRPPQRIEARGSAVLHDETRPLCPWPRVARYTGSGKLNDSSSFDCR